MNRADFQMDTNAYAIRCFSYEYEISFWNLPISFRFHFASSGIHEFSTKSTFIELFAMKFIPRFAPFFFDRFFFERIFFDRSVCDNVNVMSGDVSSMSGFSAHTTSQPNR